MKLRVVVDCSKCMTVATAGSCVDATLFDCFNETDRSRQEFVVARPANGDSEEV